MTKLTVFEVSALLKNLGPGEGGLALNKKIIKLKTFTLQRNYNNLPTQLSTF
jgi:hypothetical protein